MSTEGRLIVDDRWKGRHGIARFGQEVVGRLRAPHTVLGGPVDPLSPLDLVNPRRLRLSRRDVVYSPGFNAGITRAAQLLTLHDLIHLADPTERDARKRLYYERVVRPAVMRAGRVLTVSETSRRAVREWLGDAVPVIDVGNGCSDLFFEEVVGEQREGALYVGNLKPHKNPAAAFAAVAGTADIGLVVVTGDRAAAQRLAAEHGIAERTTIRSEVSDAELARLYGGAGALLMPSLQEGFGLPAAEALAMGCPVVHWSGCSAVVEIVANDGPRVDDPHDPGAWAAALQDALRIGPLPAARARIRSAHSWDSVAARVETQLDEMR